MSERSFLEDYQQSLIETLERINENQKELIESASEFYAAHFSITSESMRKSIDYYSTLMSRLPMYPPTFFKYQQTST
ncbi:MAG TPA: hypothetical protein VH415_10645 [Nitrososphaeraceae archaeon]|jgi:hypothetical protein